MHIKTRNVNTAFKTLVEGIHYGSIPTEIAPSRYGEVMVIEEPVIITYTHPTERVLLNPKRDANCFFHLYEALWMLAGRNDVEPLAYYNSKIREFSDDGKTFNGAYGYRWRHASKMVTSVEETQFNEVVETLEKEDVDQLTLLIEHLRNKPESRRAVLNMWTVEDDLLQIDKSRDVCCNTCIYFSVETGTCPKCSETGLYSGEECDRCNGLPHEVPRYLNMTVCNRSNDLVWGALGANACHFSVLQEYVAAHLGLDVGIYNQFTNNLHAYTERWDPQLWLRYYEENKGTEDWYPKATVPLVKDISKFDSELSAFVKHHAQCPDPYSTKILWDEPFLRDVADPMLRAFHARKDSRYGPPATWLELVGADDWRTAAMQWVERRDKPKPLKDRCTKVDQYDHNVYDPDLAV